MIVNDGKMKYKRVYLSGPMTGIEDNNFPEFERHCRMLRERGYAVVSPHEIGELDSYDAYLKADIREMMDCDAVVTITGWQESRGSRLETSTAILVGMPVITFEEAMDDSC